MPPYKVIITQRALSDLQAIHGHISGDSPDNAARVAERIVTQIDDLALLPRRHPLAPEARHFQEPLRNVIVSPYRIVYRVEGEAVTIVTIRHGARRPMRPGE